MVVYTLVTLLLFVKKDNMNIAIISSAHDTVPKSLTKKITALMESLEKIDNLKILTGGCNGILGEIIKQTKSVNIRSKAYSPDKNKILHDKRLDNLASHHFNEIEYHEGFTSRSLSMIQNSDAVLVLNGRMGTLSEFSIALEEGKKVGVLTNTGGIADHLEQITLWTNKKFSKQLLFSNNPEEIILWFMKNKKSAKD